jgi:hypothetical protein
MLFLTISVASIINVAGTSTRKQTKEGRIRHFECFNIVKLAETALNEGGSDASVTTALKYHCGNLSDVRQAICLELVPVKIQIILSDLRAKKGSEEICTDLGSPTLLHTVREVAKADCTKMIDSLKQDLKNEGDGSLGLPSAAGSDLSQLGNTIKSLSKQFVRRMTPRRFTFCRAMDKESRITCNIVSRVALKLMKTELADGTESGEICTKLQKTGFLRLTETSVSQSD